jgi:PAS domain S-box-containing protein
MANVIGSNRVSDRPARPLLIRLAPLLVFLALAGLTLLIWGEEVRYNRALLERHTEDVCLQAAQRLKIRLDSRLRVASVFAERWSTHETRDFSRTRFEEFAEVLLDQFPAFHTIRVLQTEGGVEWIVPRGAGSRWSELTETRNRLLRESRNKNEVILAPHRYRATEADLFAVLPLVRGEEFLGHLVVEFRSQELIGEVFPDQVRSEFDIQVEDGDTVLFRFSEIPAATLDKALISASNTFPIRNRTWRVAIAPRQAQIASTGWIAKPALPLLGIALSVCIALLIQLLSRRMEMYRATRDRALEEMAKREKAQEQQRLSEERYRSVFNSATDGLLVIDDRDRIVEANPAASAMHGYSPDDFLGLRYTDLIEPEHRQKFVEFRRQLASSGSVRLESAHITAEGKPFAVEVHGTNFHFGGKPRVLAILTDVSERQRAAERQAMLSRKVLMAQEEERGRVSRDLHDELGQILTALHLELDMLRKRIPETDKNIVSGFGNATAMVEKAAEELRHVCRGLRPPLLDDLGVEPAIGLLVEDFRQRTGVQVDLQVELDEEQLSVPPEVSLAVYRVLQESLNNVNRHANAKEVSISLERNGKALRLSVYDDGRGFDADDAAAITGFGIAGMRERALLVNGTIDIRSEPFQGTQVVFSVPLDGQKQRKPT